MSGDNDQSRRPAPGTSPRPAAGVNPFVDDAPTGTPAPGTAKPRRGKPPPGIISAGGVDMARAHASNIRPLAESEQKTDEAKVVLVAEKVDPRRMRTVRRIDINPEELAAAAAAARGESPWAQKGAEAVDKTALPSANLPGATKPGAAEEKKKEKALGAWWIRGATVVVILLLIAGVSKRIYMSSKRNGDTPPTAYTGSPLIPEPLPPDTASADPADPSATARVGTGHVAAPNPSGSADEEALEFITEPTASAGTKPSVRVKAPPPPPPPKPTFTPLFQLPDEKKN